MFLFSLFPGKDSEVYGTDFIFGPRMLIENVVIFLDPNPTTKKYFLQCAGKNVIVEFLPKLSPKTNVKIVWFQEMGATKDICKALLLRDGYEIIALYNIKSILTDFSASRQDKRVL